MQVKLWRANAAVGLGLDKHAGWKKLINIFEVHYYLL